MRKSRAIRMPLPFFAAAVFFAGCAHWGGSDDVGQGISEEVQRSERLALESQTSSRLATLERALNDFIQAERRIPNQLTELIPKYLANIPETALGIREHKDTNRVAYYSSDIILDGQVNGSRLRETGGWGYVHNDHQVILFVDCIHKSMNGSSWYQVRGVY